MTESDVARYVAMVEKVIKVSEVTPGLINTAVLVAEAERLADQVRQELEKEGLVYGPGNLSNESMSTARAIIWAAWVSWLWASKSETRQPPDNQAKQTRPIAEKLLTAAIEFGRTIGQEGRPEDFLIKRGLTPP
jgi:hypothetical protein